MNRERVIAIVGAGFSGTAVAMRLLQGASAPLRILLIERSAEFCRGAAYARADYPYPLNVRPTGMSATGDPMHFRNYVRRQHPELDPDGFLPRSIYGHYLQWALGEAVRGAAPAVELQCLCGDVVNIERVDRSQAVLHFAGGHAVSADDVVIATGFAQATAPSPPTPGGNSLVIVGTGLTMIDAVMAAVTYNPALTIDAISRHGLLPLMQSTGKVCAAVPPLPADVMAVRRIRLLLRRFRQMAAERIASGGDWRDLIAQIRAHVPALWGQLPRGERARFLRHARIYWDIHRHRMPPEVAERLQQLIRDGRLRLHAGRVMRIHDEGDGVRVTWRPRGQSSLQTIAATQAINCTGPAYDIGESGSLWHSLARQHLAVPDPLGQGILTGPHGELTLSGTPSWLYYVGPMLRADHMEATAVAELRDHAQRTANALLASEMSLSPSGSQGDSVGEAGRIARKRKVAARVML